MKWLYLHGFASGPESQKARYFGDRCREIGMRLEVPDLARGDFENLTISGQLDVIAEAAGPGSSILIGSSLGGYLAALYAARHPEVQKVILMAPAFGFPQLWTRTLEPQKLREWRERGFLEVYHYGERRQRRLSHRLLEDAEAYEDEPDMRQQALIFHGRNDDAVPLVQSEKYAARHPNARLRVCESDHELLDVLETLWAESKAFLLE